MKKILKVILFFIVLGAAMFVVGEIDRFLDAKFYGVEVEYEEN